MPTEVKLAIEKDSPVPGRKVLFNNLMIFTDLVVAGFGALLIYVAVNGGDALNGFLGGLLVLMNVRFFLKDWAAGGTIRKLRYTGTFEVEKISDKWRVIVPAKAFPNMQLAADMAKVFEEALASTPAEETPEKVLIYVLGVSDDDTKSYQVKLVHKCDNDGSCDKPRLHLFGYSEERDGALSWPTV
jgi:hypothetical protein